MRINIVTNPGWILERMASELAARITGVRVNAGTKERRADPHADLNYYIPARDFKKCSVYGRIAGMFTHGETGFDLIPRLEACVAMNDGMADRLRAAGAKRVSVIRPGVDRADRGPIVFGVIGRVYNSGRKGEGLVKRAVRAGFRVVSCGVTERVSAMSRKQWPCDQVCDITQRPEFYRQIDYLLVTSVEEGGPMPVVEAIAHGVPVIAPKGVGWCDEFPCLGRYEPGDWNSLKAVLHALTHPPTWAEWAEGHREVFASIGVEVAA